MKKGVICAVAALTVCTVALSACGLSTAKPKSVFRTDAEQKALSCYTLAYGEFLPDQSGKNLLMFEKSSGLTQIYNANRHFKLSVAGGRGSLKILSTDYGEAVVYTRADHTTGLYNEVGDSIASVNGEVSATTRCNLIFFGNKVYRFTSDGIKLVSEGNDLKSTDYSFTDYRAGYYYKDQTSSSRSISVYDSNLDKKAVYTIPSYVDNYNYCILAGGNILNQYVVALPDSEARYDLYVDGVKYDLVTEVFDVKSGKVKDLKADYFFESVLSRGSEDWNDLSAENSLSDKVENIITYYEIKDKRVDTNQNALKVATLDNEGRLALSISNMFDGLKSVTRAGNGHFVYRTSSGKKYLFDIDGKVKGEVTNAVGFTDSFVISEDCIYDYDLNLITDSKEQGYKVKGITGNTIFYENSGDIFQYEDSSFNLITSSSNCYLECHDEYYCLYRGGSYSDSYEYFNADNTKILNSETKLVQVYKSGSNLLFKGESEYYLFSEEEKTENE